MVHWRRTYSATSDLMGKGLGGVEQFYNSKIAGEPGRLFLEKDANGKPYESYEIASKPGQTVVLTIDQSIQFQAEQVLLAAVQRSRAKSGSVIVLDPRSGEILALANAPTFDPNKVQRQNPKQDRTGRFKIFTSRVRRSRSSPSPQRWRRSWRRLTIGSIARWARSRSRVVWSAIIHAFGSLTIAEALAKSSNVAAIKLGIRVGDPAMYDYIKRFGFGSRTGIELPGETAGILRKVERWQASSIGSIAIGQEIGVTPVQMVAAFGALANDGVRMAPHLIREVRNAEGAVVYQRAT